MKHVLLFSFLFSAISGLAGFMPYYYKIGHENGLPSMEINSMVQHETGYIFLATEAGLYRYDGLRFEPMHHPSLLTRSIHDLQFDKDNNLWCSNNKGQLFRVTVDSLILVFQYQGTSDQFRYCHFEGPGVWLIEPGKMSWISPNGELGTSLPLPFLEIQDLNDLEFVGFKHYVVLEANGKGIFIVDLKKKSIFSIPYPEISLGKKHFERSLFVMEKKLFLVLGDEYPLLDGNIYWVDLDQRKLKNIFHYINPLRIANYNYQIDRKNRLWITSSFGAFCIKSITLFTFPEHIFFFQNKITCMLQDHEGTLWFADPEKGLLVVPHENIIMLPIRNLKPRHDGVNMLFPLAGLELIGADINGDIFRITPGKSSFHYISSDWGKPLVATADLKVIGDTCIAAHGMISLFDTSGKFHVHFENYTTISDLETDKKYLWATDKHYIFRASLNKLIHHHELVFDTVIKRHINSIGIDPSSGNLFFSQPEGLAYLDSAGALHEPAFGRNLDVKRFFASDSSLFLATYNRGLIEIQQGKIKRDWLNGKTINHFSASSKYLWIAGENELFNIDKQSGEVLKMCLTGGLAPSEINFISNYNNFTVLLTKESIIMVPDSINFMNHTRPLLTITEIRTDDGLLEQTESIELPYDFSNLRISFRGFSFSSGRSIHYGYRLIGLDSNWTYTSAEQTTAQFPSLPAGKYVLELKALNESETESKIIRISFTVNSPFWMKWWFYLLLVVVIGGLVALLFQIRIKSLQKKNSIEKKMIASQLTALKAQMNPHFMYNALNSIQDLILANDHVNSNRYLVRFSTLMRKVLDVSGKESITLQEEIDILGLYLDLEKLRFGNDFNYAIRCENIPDTDSVDLPPMILQPFVENAMKHGLFHKKGEKNLVIAFIMEEHLICTITDNGVGRKRAEEIRQRKHQSFASKAIEMRISLLNEYTSREYRSETIDLYENGEPSGTKVIVHFPIYSDQ